MVYRVLLVGGGTGGHVYPLVAVARALQQRAAAQGKSIELLMMGDGPFVTRAAKEAGVRSVSITAPKLRRYTSAGNFLDLFKVPIALVQSLFRLLLFMPDVVFAKGGYTCAFPILAARFYMIPVYLHESDSVAGLANRMLARRSRLIFTAFASADQQFQQLGRPTMLVGNPVRRELTGVDHLAALQGFRLATDKKTIFITGGSQGAAQLNDVVLNSVVRMVQAGYNIIHHAGDALYADVKGAIEQYMKDGASTYAPLIAAQYRIYPFLNESEMAAALGAADVVVTRAGGQALSEIAYLGKPCIVVPLAGSANNHQVENAREIARYGAVVMEGLSIPPDILMAQVARLLEPTVYADVSERIRAFAHADAADRIAQTLLG